jgi:hypothetical protein
VANPFDAELYLRRAGERSIIDAPLTGGAPWDSPLAEAGQALAAIGAISLETARQVVDDYQLAATLRGRHGGPRGMRRPPPPSSPPPVLTAARAVACERDVTQPWGRLHVHYVVLGDESTTLAITADESASGPAAPFGSGPRGRPKMRLASFQQVSLTDDQGTTEVAGFNGSGGSPGRWQGQLVTPQPLSRDTRWIDIGGVRLDLPRIDADPPTVRIEPRAGTDLAERYLRLRLATASPGGMGLQLDGVETSIQTLVAAGALDEDAPVVVEARAVVAAFSGTGGSSALPAPWASLLARQGVPSGPSGSIPIGVVTPPIDGVTLSIEGLVTTDQGFEIHVITSPGIALGPTPWHTGVDRPRMAWWAEDDRGNHYLGGTNGWSGSPDRSACTIAYWPPIDARATELRLIPTALAERAVVTLDHLPWAKRR